MALNFPNSPGIGSVFTDTTSGFSYQWDGTLWKSYSPASSSNIQILDDISGSFNGSTTSFALTVAGVSFTPANSQQLRVVLGGVVQAPGTDYYVSASNIVFTTAPTSGLSFSGVSLGPAVPINTIVDGTITAGSLGVVGLLTAAKLQVTGISTFAGISTFQSSAFGTNLSLTGVATASSFVGNLTGTASTASFATTSFGLSGTPNVTVGFITATEFDISGSTNTLTAGGLNVGVSTLGIATATNLTSQQLNVSGISTFAGIATYTASLFGTQASFSGVVTATSAIVGSAVTINSSGINAAGVVTATSFSGSGASLTGIVASGTLIRAPQILTSGTSYTTPSNCTKIYVECVGAGGAGGGVGGTGENGGAGGGSGAYCAKYFTVSGSTSYTYAIGSGGSGNSNATGSSGGSTTFTVGATTISAGGGGGGTGSNTIGNRDAGTGGSASNGDINVTGSGGQGTVDGASGRWGGVGGASFFGGSGRGRGYTNGAGDAGSAGGGGGGASSYNGGGAFAGGAGGNGLIRVWEYT